MKSRSRWNGFSKLQLRLTTGPGFWSGSPLLPTDTQPDGPHQRIYIPNRQRSTHCTPSEVIAARKNEARSENAPGSDNPGKRVLSAIGSRRSNGRSGFESIHRSRDALLNAPSWVGQRHSTPSPDRDVAQIARGQPTEPEMVVPVHRCVPTRTLPRCRRSDLDLRKGEIGRRTARRGLDPGGARRRQALCIEP